MYQPMKIREEQSWRADGARHRLRGKRKSVADTNRAFLKALADALRDILRDERTRAA